MIDSAATICKTFQTSIGSLDVSAIHEKSCSTEHLVYRLKKKKLFDTFLSNKCCVGKTGRMFFL